VDAILSANRLAVGAVPERGSAVYRYDYSGDGLTGLQTDTEDLATGAFLEQLDAGVRHTAGGYDGHTPWMRDMSGANTPQEGGDRVRVAISAAYRNAHLWWRGDRGGAQVEVVGRENLEGTPTDHLRVQPHGGVRFEAWFDARTHLLRQIAEPQLFFSTRRVFSDYRREAGVMLAHRVLIDSGTGKEGYERLSLRSASFGAERPSATFACPRTPLTGVTLINGATSTSVPFRLLNNHIYLEARVNGTGPYTFIVDTGGHTLLSSSVVSKARLSLTGKAPESGAGEKQSSGGYAPVHSISIGGLEMHDQTVFITEIYSPDIEGIQVDGMVGFELFRRLVVQIDYGRQRLTFTDPAHYPPTAAGVPIPFVFYDHVPLVRGQIDSDPALFDIDTGSRSAIDVTSPTVARLSLRSRYSKGVRAVTGWGVGGPTKAYVVRLQQIRLGPVTIAAPVAGLSESAHGSFSDPNFDGNIGSGLLEQFVVTFDYGHQMMYLQPIEPRPPDTGDFDRSGLWINAAHGGYEVTSVAEASPAAQAGLVVGDVIMELDGQPAAAQHLSDARQLLRTRPAGTKVPMLVKGKTTTRRVIVTLRDLI
jgi:hypothetical protein